MSINQRRHIRFSLDIPALLVTRFGERYETILQQISVGGCFTDWEENIYTGDEFRLEVELPNRNRLPLKCKALYCVEDTGIGATFIDITAFEQELISTIISNGMKKAGLPGDVDPFRQPSEYVRYEDQAKPRDERVEKERLLEKIMSGEENF